MKNKGHKILFWLAIIGADIAVAVCLTWFAVRQQPEPEPDVMRLFQFKESWETVPGSPATNGFNLK